MQNKSESKEDYLRAMYSIYEKLDTKSDGIRPVDIASSLDIAKSSVTSMIKKLSADDLVENKPYQNIHFTKKGLAYAKKKTHDYRVIEVFLADVLNIDKDEVSEEAHLLEHAFSQKVIRKLDKFLNNPKTCPHGNKIH